MYAFVVSVVIAFSGGGFSEAECLWLEQHPDLQSGFPIGNCSVCGSGRWARCSCELKPGDIVIYASGDCLTSTAFVVATGSSITHVMVIVRARDGTLCVLDADKSTGVRMMPAIGYIRCCLIRHGQVYIRQLKVPLTDEQDGLLTASATHEIGKPYAPLHRLMRVPRNLFMIRNVDPRDVLALDRANWFCSEITAAALIRVELLSDTIDVETVSPKFFAPPVIRLNSPWGSVRKYCAWDMRRGKFIR